MDKYKKLAMIMCSVGLMFLLTGITYSFFNYTRTGDENVLVAGDIYMHLNEGNDQITLTNIFPETKEEARARNDNYITFTIDGLNESRKDIYYEIDLIHGDDITGYTRFNDEHLVFDLIEIGTNNEETYLVNARSFDSITSQKIWVDTIDGSTTSEIEKTYKLRMWLSDNVIISDTDPNADYPATGENAYKNHFASVKVRVIGDFTKKEIPSAYIMLRDMADTTTLINFASKSSSTNGEGLYLLPGTEEDDYPIYYYRGEIDNNNVVFGGFCWQIVRTTDTGGIKMIYNGEPEVTGSGNNIIYNCGDSRSIRYFGGIKRTVSLNAYYGYYYSDDYEILEYSINNIRLKLKSGQNPITRVIMRYDNDGVTNIPVIAVNYPYTCLSTSEDTECSVMYKVIGYESGRKAYVYESVHRTTVGNTEFNNFDHIMSAVGYMYNEAYVNYNSTTATGAVYGKNIEWHGDHYLVIDDTANLPSTNPTKDNYHHYSCGTATNNIGDSECSIVRYYFYDNYYIELENGDLLEDAIYKMTGNGSNDVKARNSSYNLNENNSTIKDAIDNWFKDNLTNEVNINAKDYRTYIEDTVYCNDRSFHTIGSDANTFVNSGWNPNGGNLSNGLKFATYDRLQNNWFSTSNVPSLTCPNDTDRFSMNNPKAHLDYPVGLITEDELILSGDSGTVFDQNNNYYLYSYIGFDTLSPSSISGSYNSIFTNRLGSTDAQMPANIRPVISLKLGVEFEEDGDGTPTNPYVVKYN